MAKIIPIRGIRYNPEKIDDLSKVVAPPYDVISPAAQQRYYHRHPYNIIRLECGKTYPTDDETNNRYTRASAAFNSWLQQKVLVPEDKPALYLYQQEFIINGERKVRSGFICAVKIEPYEKGIVLPHEETMPKYKEDRLALMKACRANFSPIFGLYNDAGFTVDSILQKAAGSTPDIEFVDEEKITHRLTVISDAGVIKQVQENMQRQRIFIADGHHRYETALNYRNHQREELGLTGEPGDKPFDYVMMTLVNLYDPGLVIQPTHRLIKNVEHFNLSKLIKELKKDFTVEEFAVHPGGDNLQAFIDLVFQKGGLARGMGIDHRWAFGLYAGKGQGYVITLENETAWDRLMPREKSPAWQGLDVSVLHKAILERLLNIGGEQLADEKNITYTRNEIEALELVDSGKYQAVFFMNPTLLDEFTAIAIGGEKMPPKSTYFYPKLITGLVINKL
ncbi:uncharacterized protein (DUF1015 family) [Desulfohalotomaculum tongense]|uniref:DUF1015 family protein n=1 Tax=Desulforadius tongensis TaxID=1216062 RepID=UPI00195B171B|nr:uncharacterized protein (DUF1015 family) [Desulforadius tongensis]